MPRKKSDSLPTNLYLEDGRYRYRLPDGRRRSLGNDHFKAVQAAAVLNAEFQAQKDQGLLSSVRNGSTLRNLIVEFVPVKERGVKEATFREIKYKLKRYTADLGNEDVGEVSVRDLDIYLTKIAPSYGSYKQHKALLTELFAFAIGKGYRSDFKGNPGKALLTPKLARKQLPRQRVRLTRELFTQVYAIAEPWFQVAMDIALQTGLRRSDVALLKWQQWDGEFLRVIPQKTAEHPNPPALAIRAGETLKAAIERAKELPPLSDYIVHRTNSNRSNHQKGRTDRGQVTPEQLTRTFTQLRKQVADIPNAPTFHEIRSLSSRLYKDQGRADESVQLLLGHADKEMTHHYQQDNDAPIEWQETWTEV